MHLKLAGWPFTVIGSLFAWINKKRNHRIETGLLLIETGLNAN